MKRVNVYDYSDDQRRFVGWYDSETATEYPEGTYWNGNNLVSLATRDYARHQELIRTAHGRWVIHEWARWQHSTPSHRFVTDDEAREWLLVNEYDEPAIEAALGESIADESSAPAMGRPEIGQRVEVRLPDDLLAAVDAASQAAGMTRAAWLRQVIENAVS